MKNILLFLILFAQVFFAQENALVRQNDKFGYINKTGNFSIEPKYKVAKNFSEGLAAVEIDGKWGFINTKGEIIIIIHQSCIQEQFVTKFVIPSKGSCFIPPGHIDIKCSFAVFECKDIFT